MKKIIFITIILLALIALGFYLKQFIVFNGNDESMNEYTPQQEISDEQFRQTFVSLEFKDTRNGGVKTRK
ncbi:MAG: hypothetical protein FWF46_04645 [Oscillospiraceae bacterium]|nr:hypothetical protein [Oscillospiraceae bacterium]